MAYLFAICECYACRGQFACNPELVPTVVVEPTIAGRILGNAKERREPICRPCVQKANQLREARGVEPILIQPGAYDVGRRWEVSERGQA